MAHEDVRKQAIDLYKEGRSRDEIATTLGIKKSTLGTWISKTTFSEAEQARIDAARLKRKQKTACRNNREGYHRHRAEAYQEGRDSSPAPKDDKCVGLYAAEGSKHLRANGKRSPGWQVSNADRNVIKEMIGWALRTGIVNQSEFTAEIQIHEGLPNTEEQIREYWAEAGIPAENIGFYRFKNRRKRDGEAHRMPWGVCNLKILNKKGARLYWYWRGQRDRLEGMAPFRQESLDLLEQLRNSDAE